MQNEAFFVLFLFMNLILFDSKAIRENLLPFTFTRPVSGIRVGISTIAQKWEVAFDRAPSFLVQDYLKTTFPLSIAASNVLINGGVCPDDELVRAIHNLKEGQALLQEDILLAGKCNDKALLSLNGDVSQLFSPTDYVSYTAPVTIIRNLWDIFMSNGSEIRKDFFKITNGRTTQPVHDPYTRMYDKENIFIEEGATIRAAVLNASTGPIYIGKNTEVMEGAVIRGPFALCEGSVVAMGTKVRGDTTVGPYSKVGGEINNSIIFGYSNKGHDGFLGNAVIGEWCNLGAATNTSNLKNNYGEVKIWNYPQKGLMGTGLQFCGLIMGDHAHCGINTMFNTGTVVGVGANIFGAGFPPKFVPSFSWADGQKFSTYKLDKFLATVGIMMKRRNKALDNEEKNILTHIFELSARFRNWEK